jgi:acyl dehydratase
MAVRYLEDFSPGQILEAGPRPVSADEIIAFARQFDPQDFYLDAAAAKKSDFGGLVASGWHTIAMCMRLIFDGQLHDTASLGSPGIDEVRWVKPVRPGDALRLRVHVREVTPSRSKPDRGVIRAEFALRNQRDETVLTMKGVQMFHRRPNNAESR